MAEILEIIHKEIQARGIGQKVELSDSRFQHISTSNRLKPSGGTTRSFLSKAQNERERLPLRCYYCQGEHTAAKCHENFSVETSLVLIAR